MATILGYWNVRGIATPIRLILCYADVDFVFKEYDILDTSDWFKNDKLKLNLDFPNLPYLIDGDVKLTQSLTILDYLGRKYELDGKTENEKQRMSLILQQIADVRSAICNIVSPHASTVNREEVQENLRKEYASALPARLALISKFMGTNQWVAGDRLTYADFSLYDALDTLCSIFNLRFSDYPNLVDYMERVETLPKIGEFLANKVEKLPNKAPQYGRYAFFWNNLKNDS